MQKFCFFLKASTTLLSIAYIYSKVVKRGCLLPCSVGPFYRKVLMHSFYSLIKKWFNIYSNHILLLNYFSWYMTQKVKSVIFGLSIFKALKDLSNRVFCSNWSIKLLKEKSKMFFKINTNYIENRELRSLDRAHAPLINTWECLENLLRIKNVAYINIWETCV